MTFFVKARKDESIVLRTYGFPINIASRWSLIPFPCCQSINRFNLGAHTVHFDCKELTTKDKIDILLTITVKFVVDRSSKAKIMKAYKDFFGDEEVERGEIVNVEDKTLSIISKVLGMHAAKMTLDELIQFNWLFVDSTFTEIKYILKDSCVVFQELMVDEIQRADENGVKTCNKEEEKVKEIKGPQNEIIGNGVLHLDKNTLMNGHAGTEPSEANAIEAVKVDEEAEDITAMEVEEVFAEPTSEDFDDKLCLIEKEEDTISTVSVEVGDKSKVVRQITGVAIEIQERCKPSRQVSVGFYQMEPNFTIAESP